VEPSSLVIDGAVLLHTSRMARVVCDPAARTVELGPGGAHVPGPGTSTCAPNLKSWNGQRAFLSLSHRSSARTLPAHPHCRTSARHRRRTPPPRDSL